MNEQDFAAIVGDVTAGTPVRTSLALHSINPEGFYRGLAANPEWEKQYARAKELACAAYADETLAIADEEPPQVDTQFGSHVDAGFVQWQRNRIETRKWHLSKLLPKIYGDRTVLSGDADAPLQVHTVVEFVKGAAQSEG